MQISPFLVLHISGGVGGILSGAVALIFRKGSRGHVLAGRIFVIAMLTMSGTGAYMAYFVKPNIGNVLGGVMTFYMVATAWATARRRDAETGFFDWCALAIVLAAGTMTVIYGFEAAYSPTGLKEGYPAWPYLMWAFVAVLSAAGDVRMLTRGGVFSGGQRIVRHLWRMCLGLFIASASFFLGQQKVFPASWRGATVWFVPAFLPLLLMIFWLFRVRFTNTFRRKSTSRGGAHALPARLGA